jgi:hypothetical protein
MKDGFYLNPLLWGRSFICVAKINGTNQKASHACPSGSLIFQSI